MTFQLKIKMKNHDCHLCPLMCRFTDDWGYHFKCGPQDEWHFDSGYPYDESEDINDVFKKTCPLVEVKE